MIPNVRYKTISNTYLGQLPDCISCIVTEERNGKYELEMTYPKNGVNADYLVYNNVIEAVPSYNRDTDYFRIYEVKQSEDMLMTIRAEQVGYELSYATGWGGAAGNTVQDILDDIKSMCYQPTFTRANNPWTLTSSITLSEVFYIDSAPYNIKSAIELVRAEADAEYYWDRFSLQLLASRGANRGVKFTYGANIKTISEDINISDVWHGILPYWHQNITWVGDRNYPRYVGDGTSGTTYRDYYGFPWGRYYAVDFTSEFDSTPTQAQLYTKARKYMKENELGIPDVTITIDARTTNEDIRLCDTVTVAYSPLGIDLTTKVTATKWNVLLDRYESITIGTLTKKLEKILAKG